MQHRKLGYVLFALAAAAAAAGCTVNGKPLFQLGARAPAPAVNGDAAPATTGPLGPAVAQTGPTPSFPAWCQGLRKDDSLHDATNLRDALDPAAGPNRA
jgi:hypothetical protein